VGVSFPLFVVLVVRFELLAVLSFMLFGNLMGGGFHLTIDASAWYLATTFVVLAAVTGVCGYACHVANAGRSLFKDELLER
jgi:hypothetical protein